MGTKKITVCHKRKDCIGCGSCALLAPNRWTLNNEDGLSDLRGAEWHGDQFMVAEIDEHELEENVEAAKACPVNIIRIEGHKKIM